MNADAVAKIIAKMMEIDVSAGGQTGGPPVPPFPPSGGGGSSDDMEGRVAKLEAHVETLLQDTGAVKRDVGEIRVNLATLTERIAHLPGKGFVVTSTSTTIGLIGAIILFGDNIRAALGL